MNASAGDLRLYQNSFSWNVNPSLSASVPLAPAPGSWIVGHTGVISTTNPPLATQIIDNSMYGIKPDYLLKQILQKLTDLDKRIEALDKKLEAKQKAEILAKMEEIVQSMK